MAGQKKLPQGASVALPDDAGRLHAPAAARNGEAILALLQHHGPAEGRALEIASGTGQHVAQFARALPALHWHPSEVDAARRGSIKAWTIGLPNVDAPLALDATAQGWAQDAQGFDLVLVVNLLHLISTPEAQTVITEASKALAPAGRLVIYGPFLRDGETTSDGDAAFHASLVHADSRIGYKDDFDMIDWLQGAALTLVDVVEMPANNLAFVAERAA